MNTTLTMDNNMMMMVTSSSSSSITGGGIVPLYLKILASIFYIFSIILGVGGNTLVLLVVIHFRRRNIKTNVTNFFILSLAISDLIFILLCVPSTYITAYLIQYWPFSNILCVFLNYMQNVSFTLVVYTLIWMTLDKFLALIRPLKQQRLTIKASKYLILLTWLFSLFISLPIALFTKLVYNKNTNIIININNNNNNKLTNNITYQFLSTQNFVKLILTRKRS
jgi:neuropeptide Y receptor